MAIESTLARLKNYFIGWHKANYEVLHQMTDEIENKKIPVSGHAVYKELGITQKGDCEKIESGTTVWGHICAIWRIIGEKLSTDNINIINNSKSKRVCEGERDNAFSTILGSISYLRNNLNINKYIAYTKPHTSTSSTTYDNINYNLSMEPNVWENLNSIWDNIGIKYKFNEQNVKDADSGKTKKIPVSFAGNEKQLRCSHISGSIWTNICNIWGQIDNILNRIKTIQGQIDSILNWINTKWKLVNHNTNGYISAQDFKRHMDVDRQVLLWDKTTIGNKSWKKLTNKEREEAEKLVIYRWGTMGVVKFNDFDMTKFNNYESSITDYPSPAVAKPTLNINTTNKTLVIVSLSPDQNRTRNFVPAVRCFGSTYMESIEWMAIYKPIASVKASGTTLKFGTNTAGNPNYGIAIRFRTNKPTFNGTIIYPIDMTYVTNYESTLNDYSKTNPYIIRGSS